MVNYIDKIKKDGVEYNIHDSRIDETVLISTDEGSTWSEPISLQQFISNCEAGNVYAVGTQAKIINCFRDNKDYRFILIGTNIDILASDDTTKVKTTWQFLDMPVHNVRLGLPFNIIDWGSNIGRAFASAYLDGTNSSPIRWYASNKSGYTSAIELLNVLHVIYEGLPTLFKQAIKTVRKAFTIPRQDRFIAQNGGTETDTSASRYIAQKLFHLSATEMGSSDYQHPTEGTTYSYLNTNEKRIRYYNGIAEKYWLRTVSLIDSQRWYYTYNTGHIINANVDYDCAVAPAFCI